VVFFFSFFFIWTLLVTLQLSFKYSSFSSLLWKCTWSGIYFGFAHLVHMSFHFLLCMQGISTFIKIIVRQFLDQDSGSEENLENAIRVIWSRNVCLSLQAGWTGRYCWRDHAAETLTEVSNRDANVSVAAVSLLSERLRTGLWITCFALWRLWCIGLGAVSDF